MVTIGNPYAAPPHPNSTWQQFYFDEERIGIVEKIAAEMGFAGQIEVVRAAANGNITVRLNGHPNAADRGQMLRAFERKLWDGVSVGLYVYVEPQEDRNRLRQLRGVKVKDA